jgi:hypothetical protein
MPRSPGTPACTTFARNDSQGTAGPPQGALTPSGGGTGPARTRGPSHDAPRPGSRIGRRHHHAARAAAASAALVAALLAGCYVVPMDPRTGAPILPPAAPQATRAAEPGYPAPVPAAPSSVLLQARLYPLNETANRGGIVTAQVADNQGGRGSFSLHYHGQLMQGEATRVDAGFAGFGRIHDEVLGPATRSYTGRRGVANAYGSQGVNAQCEYLITGPSLGTGVCLFSDGAKYQMHF